MKTNFFLSSALAVVLFASTLSQKALAEHDDKDPKVCFSARVLASDDVQGTIIMEATPIADTMEKASELGLTLCHQTYPARTCEVAGHLIVDCP